jgi:capsular polysaccharide biosynthesis protein
MNYTVVLAVPVVPVAAGQAALADLQEELEARLHLDRPQVTWDSEQQTLVVTVGVEDSTPEAAAANMAEELFEIAAAVLPDFQAMRVEIVRVDVA